MRFVVSLCGLLCLLLAACGGPDSLTELVPENIGGLERVELLTGDGAMEAVNNLHGKKIAAQDGVVARYAAKGGVQAEIWITRAPNAADAREQVAIMMDKMVSSPQSPFSNPSSSRRGGNDIYRVTGMGDAHLVWSDGDLAWWVSVNPEMEPVLMRALLGE